MINNADIFLPLEMIGGLISFIFAEISSIKLIEINSSIMMKWRNKNIDYFFKKIQECGIFENILIIFVLTFIASEEKNLATSLQSCCSLLALDLILKGAVFFHLPISQIFARVQ